MEASGDSTAESSDDELVLDQKLLVDEMTKRSLAAG